MEGPQLFRRNLWRGVCIWLAIGALGVAARGVQWEESYERAQAMLGMVQYPPGHPLHVYAWNAPTIQYYASAALLWLTESPLIVCGLRNLVAIWILLVPMFLLGASFTRSIVAGHIAALLMLANAHSIFQSYYDNNVWPNMFTSGSIGLGWALLCVAALAYARWRLGFFLIAAMPLIHGGQWPPVLVLGIVTFTLLLVQKWRPCFPLSTRPGGEREVVRGEHVPATRLALQGLCAGALVTLAFLALHLLLRKDIPDYGTPGSISSISDTWQRFTYFEDIHRRPNVPPRFGPFFTTSIGLSLALLLSSGWLLGCLYKGPQIVPAAIAFAYCTVCAAAVWIAWLCQQWLQMETPYFIIGWLPYRLGNHAVFVMLALAAALVYQRKPSALAIAPLGWLLVQQPLAIAVEAWIFSRQAGGYDTITGIDSLTRYVIPAEGPMFVLLGMALAVVFFLLPKRSYFTHAWLLLSASTLAWMLFSVKFYFLCLLLGLAAARIPMTWAAIARPKLLTAMAACTALLLVTQQALYPYHLPVSPFEAQVREQLAQDPDQSSLVVTPLYTINYQERLNRGIFATFETQLLIPYMPELGPRIEVMLTDMYGFRFGEAWSWELDAWQERSHEEWAGLAERYQLGYVLCPEEWPLQLPELMRGEGKVLYRIKD